MQAWKEWILRLALPSSCLLCHQDLPAHNRNNVCAFCAAALRRHPRHDRSPGKAADSIFSAGVFSGSLRDLIHRLKYGGKDYLTPLLADFLMSDSFKPTVDAVSFVPSSYWKELRRGFNQSRLLASAVAKKINLPLIDGGVRRHGLSSQVGLSRRQRLENVRKMYRAPRQNHRSLRGVRVLLVDDVITTGATLLRCAELLKSAGAKEVHCAVVARDEL